MLFAVYISLLMFVSVFAQDVPKNFDEFFKNAGKDSELHKRIRRFQERITSPNEKVRNRVLYDLTYNAIDVKDSKIVFKMLLKDSDPKIRASSLDALAQLSEPLKKSELPESVQNKYNPKETYDLKDEGTIQKFLEKIESGKDPQVGWIISLLAIIGEKKAIPAIKDRLEDQNSYVKFEACKALAMFGDYKSAKPALEDMVADFTHFYTLQAMKELLRNGSKEYIGTMIEFLGQIEDLDETENPNVPGAIDQTINMLESATNEYFTTSKKWSKWWEDNKAKLLKDKNQKIPTAPEYKDPSGPLRSHFDRFDKQEHK